MPAIRLGTRGSALALLQAQQVASRLRAAFPGLEPVVETIKTRGDRVLDRPLSQIGGEGLFTKELERALAEGRVDLCVHSMKDLPSMQPTGLVLAGCLARGDARDALVAAPQASLSSLAPGSRVGCGALRRLSQLRSLRPDLDFVSVRGNLDTRLAKLEEGSLDAIVLALAGLERMGYGGRVAEVLDCDAVTPAAGQGAIGLEIRAGDGRAADVCARLVDEESSLCVDAERRVMAVLEGGCQVPLGAYARFEGERLTLDAFVGSIDGSRQLKCRRSLALSARDCSRAPEAAREAARRLAEGAAQELLFRGARDVLDRARACGDERRPL